MLLNIFLCVRSKPAALAIGRVERKRVELMVTHYSEGMAFLDHWHHDLKNSFLLRTFVDEISPMMSYPSEEFSHWVNGQSPRFD